MGITKKAISIGVSAAMLASLVAVVVAPTAAFADTSTVSAGVVPQGGTSTGTASFTFNDASTFVAGGSGGFCTLGAPYTGFTVDATMTVQILDNLGGNTVTFSGTPVITAPASLQASVALAKTGVADDSFTVTIAGCDPNNVEQFTVSGLKIAATALAAPGAIEANIVSGFAGVVTATSATASGYLATFVPAGDSGFQVFKTSTCDFVAPTTAALELTVGTAAGVYGAAATFAAGTPDTFGGLPTSGVGSLGTAQAGGVTVTQTVPNCSAALESPGTVGVAVTQNTMDVTTVYPNENNQPTGQTTVAESYPGTLVAGAVLTFTLPAGVTFSAAPSAERTAGDITLTATTCALTFGLQSCSVTVNTASTVASTIEIYNIEVDVASSVANGGAVTMTLTTTVPVIVTSNIVAYSNRVLVGVGAVPNLYIGYNGQNSGELTVTESSAGFFQAGSGGNNQLEICITSGNDDQFMFAPWAIVTTGNLLLENTSTYLGVSSTAATLTDNNQCATWVVYAASTVASTITIVGANASGALPVAAGNGPTLSVNIDDTPGPEIMTVTTGNPVVYSTQVTNGIRVFKNGVVVAAVPPIPFIASGSTGTGANLTFSETLNGQLVGGEYIECDIVPIGPNPIEEPAFFQEANSNELPVVSTNTSSGLIATLSDWGNDWFEIYVSQQAVSPALGVITVSNINYNVATAVANGSINLDCYNETFADHTSLATVHPNQGYEEGQDFETVVTDATIGAGLQKVVMSADSSLSASGPFSTATKILTKGHSITIRIRTNPQLAGTKLGVWIAKKGTNGKWGAYKPHTSVITDVTGTAYYTYTFTSKAWLAFRFYYGGSATNAVAWSYPSQFGRVV